MSVQRRQFMQLAAGAIGTPFGVCSASAENWPAHAIHAIVPVGPGSIVDIVPRIVFEQLFVELSQSIVVENRLGAGGLIGIASIAKAEPDGYSILAQSSALTVLPWTHKSMPYDTHRDLSAAAMLGSLPNVLVTAPSKGMNTIEAFVAAARAKPGTFNFTSTGVGSATHMSAVRFCKSAGIEAVHVPLKGGPEALTEIMAGRIDFYLCPLGTALPLINDNRLVGLVVSGGERSPALPNVPTTTEAGFVDADYTFWIGLFVPSRTPRDIVLKFHAATARALANAEVAAKLKKLGFVSAPMSPEQFDAKVADELVANRSLVELAGIVAE